MPDTRDQEEQSIQEQQQVPTLASWPKQVTLFAHCTKETNWERGEQLGLAGKALRLFAHFEEIALTVQVAEDGMVTVVAVNGQPVQQKGPHEEPRDA